jgi:uncharacterized protein YjiS (DUF1127 family)
MTHLTQSLSFLSEYAYRINVWFDDLVTEYKKARAFSETVNELSRLSDSELRDIGINRGEIYDIARSTYYREER